MDSFDVGGIVHWGILKLHMDPSRLHLSLQDIEDALAFIKGDLCGREDNSILWYQFHLLRI